MSPAEQRGNSRGYSVPTGRPYALKELQAALGSLGDHLRELYDGAHPAEYEAVADALYTAFQTAAGLAPAKSYTGCSEHPNGALDPEAPDGWGRCLICNDRRRLGLRAQGVRGARAAAAPPAGEQRRLGYPVPDPRTRSRRCATTSAPSRTAASTWASPRPPRSSYASRTISTGRSSWPANSPGPATPPAVPSTPARPSIPTRRPVRPVSSAPDARDARSAPRRPRRCSRASAGASAGSCSAVSSARRAEKPPGRGPHDP